MLKHLQRRLAQSNASKALAIVAAGVPMFAHAAIATTDITAALTDVAAIGLAVFGVMVAIRLWKWVRRVL